MKSLMSDTMLLDTKTLRKEWHTDTHPEKKHTHTGTFRFPPRRLSLPGGSRLSSLRFLSDIARVPSFPTRVGKNDKTIYMDDSITST